MIDDKIRRKIRKALALATSDNPHEAERARSQAAAMMRQHNIDADGVDVIHVESVAFDYCTPRGSDNALISAIKKISGTELYLSCSYRGTKRVARVCFLGITSDAELAGYALSVLYRQMIRDGKDFKKKHPHLSAADVEVYRSGWARSAASKLQNIFPRKDTPPATKAEAEKYFSGMGTAKTRNAKVDNESRAAALYALGQCDGRNAKVLAATPDHSEKRALLTCSA